MSEQTIDPRNNPESKMKEEGVNLPGDGSVEDSGVVMSDAPTRDEGADGVIGDRITGTEGSDILAGVKTDNAYADDEA